MSRFTLCCVGMMCILISATVRAAVINFDDLQRGTIVNTQYSASFGVTISATNFTAGHPNDAIIFDSNNHTSKTDTDEQFPWSAGNLKGNNGVKKTLIIAENITDNNHDGKVDDPNDEGGQPAGLLKFKFKTPMTRFGLDLLDIDGFNEIKPDRGYISFKVAGVEKARVSFGDFVTSGNKFFDPTVVYGNRTANRIKPMDVNQLGMRTAFDEVDVDMGWSSGMDRIVFDNEINVISPEPAVLGLVVPMLQLVRRRNRA